jgi:hypothetical protein
MIAYETITEEKAMFLLSLANAVAGGKPALGFDPEHNDYIVLPSCDCNDCKAYLAAQENLRANTSVIMAIRGYIESRAKFAQQTGEVNETKH